MHMTLSWRTFTAATTIALITGIAASSEARSPRGYLTHHVGDLLKQVESADHGLAAISRLGPVLSNAHKKAEDTAKEIDATRMQLNNAAQQVKTLEAMEQKMAHSLEALPAATPGRAALLDQMRAMEKQTAEIAASINNAEAKTVSAGKQIASTSQSLANGAAAIKSNDGKIHTVRGHLHTAESILKGMNEVASHFPDIPDIKALK